MVQATPSPPAGAVPLRARLHAAAPWLAVLAASIAFRLPPLINAPGTNSDAAIVGLQAMHILRGEWSWFLLGSGYQTSVDALVAAIFFAVTGPSPFWLMASTLIGHIVLTWFSFSILRRRLSPWLAALLVLPLVFAPDPVHTYVLYPPRQASLTLVFASFWLLDRASAARRLDAAGRPSRGCRCRRRGFTGLAGPGRGRGGGARRGASRRRRGSPRRLRGVPLLDQPGIWFQLVSRCVGLPEQRAGGPRRPSIHRGEGMCAVGRARCTVGRASPEVSF